MKNINKILAVAVVGTSIVSLQSCKKYEDGPLISLQSKTTRLTGEWTNTAGELFDDGYNVFVDFQEDNDCIFGVSGYYTINIPYNGTFEYYYSVRWEGNWDWIDNKKGIELHLSYDNGYFLEDIDYEWVITRLTNRELNVTDIYDNDWEFQKK